MTNMLQLSCDNGDQVEIREDELATVTEDDLELLGIPRADLNRCFAERQADGEPQAVRPGAPDRRTTSQRRLGSNPRKIFRRQRPADAGARERDGIGRWHGSRAPTSLYPPYLACWVSADVVQWACWRAAQRPLSWG